MANFADVAKHVALMYCLGALQRKDSALFVLDSHAGRGFYDLQAAEAHKSGEAERGIQRLIETSFEETVLSDYFAAIRARRGKRLARYPGSPALIAGGLRPQDRALFVELMPAEARAAEREVESLGRTRTEIGDGYAALKAFLPPEERRGLVLIDPPYESLDELKLMLQAFKDAYRRWPSGVFLMCTRSAAPSSAAWCTHAAKRCRSRKCCLPTWPFTRMMQGSDLRAAA
jgi:23S rRNA (adenine2030-N6)-methyltransferase